MEQIPTGINNRAQNSTRPLVITSELWKGRVNLPKALIL